MDYGSMEQTDSPESQPFSVSHYITLLAYCLFLLSIRQYVSIKIGSLLLYMRFDRKLVWLKRKTEAREWSSSLAWSIIEFLWCFPYIQIKAIYRKSCVIVRSCEIINRFYDNNLSNNLRMKNNGKWGHNVATPGPRAFSILIRVAIGSSFSQISLPA